jgi:hypothetical protein
MGAPPICPQGSGGGCPLLDGSQLQTSKNPIDQAADKKRCWASEEQRNGKTR